MTMQQAKSKIAQRRSEIGKPEIDLIVDGLDESQIKSILLVDGWHNTADGTELVQFAIGRAHSPLTPSRTWTYFRYLNEQDMLCYSPVESILAVSPDPFDAEQQKATPQKTGTFQRQT